MRRLLVRDLFTVCFGLNFTWQQTLAMAFIGGIVNIIITVTKLRTLIIKSIPVSLQHAISGEIRVFITYIGIKNAELLQFTSNLGAYNQLESRTVIASSSKVPTIVTLNTPAAWLALIGLVLTIVLLVLKVKEAILISIVATALLEVPMDLTFFGS